MKNRISSTILLIFLLPLTSLARDFQYEGINYTIIDEVNGFCKTKDGSGLRIPGNNVSGNVVVPYAVYDENKRYIVKEIGSYSFNNRRELTSIALPPTLTAIGEGAFRKCSGLTSIEIPNSVKSIQAYAFYDCSSLSEVKLSTALTVIGKSAFDGTKLTAVELPNSLESIGKCAFDNCLLTSVYIPDNVKLIDAGAFNCEIIVGKDNSRFNSLNGILYSKDMSEIVLYPKNLNFCSDILNNISIIGDGAFYGCSMTSIVLPATINGMGEWAFENCSQLKIAVLSPSIPYIPTGAFAYCENLENVTIPNTVEVIRDAAFACCSSLSNIIIPNSVHTIGDEEWDNSSGGVFTYCISLKNIEIPNSVTKIGGFAFASSGLESIILPNSIVEIGGYAFHSCGELQKVVLPKNVSDLYCTFMFCRELKEIYYSAKHPIVADRDIFDEEVYNNATLYVTEEAVAQVKYTQPWSLFDKIETYVYSGINEVLREINVNDPMQIFTLEGIKIDGKLDSLSKGIYLIRQGDKCLKVAID